MKNSYQQMCRAWVAAAVKAGYYAETVLYVAGLSPSLESCSVEAAAAKMNDIWQNVAADERARTGANRDLFARLCDLCDEIEVCA